MMRQLLSRRDFRFVVFGFQVFIPTARALPTADWINQFGTSGGDFASAAAVDLWGNAYISGATQGNLQVPSNGLLDAYLRKFDASGIHAWTREIGTAALFEGSSGVAIDGLGDVYFSGNIGATLTGTDTDAFIEKIASDGTPIWQSRLGTGGNENDVGIAIGGSEQYDIYISGTTDGNLAPLSRGGQDRFLAKYDRMGNRLWVRQFGGPANDFGHAVAVDSLGNAIVAGSTDGDFITASRGHRDFFVQKYATDGSLLWQQQDGTTSDDVVSDVCVDQSGNIYITGYILDGSLVGGIPQAYDAFIRKIDPFGAVEWTRELVSNGLDYGIAVAVAANGVVYMGGETSGNLGSVNAGGFDAYYARFASNGALLSLEQFGTPWDDTIKDIAVNSAGNIVFVGDTLGSLVGSNAGVLDAFIFRKTIVPEPMSGCIVASFGFSLLVVNRWRGLQRE